MADQVYELSTGAGQLARFVQAGGPVVVLTGAGISTDSGIPDYRGPTGARRRHVPMTYQAFVSDPAARHRYWARSYLGWQAMAAARPNPSHHAVAAMQRGGVLGALITQNVDGLHQAAGAIGAIELHGGLDRVTCLTCAALLDRRDIGVRLRAVNPNFQAHLGAINPDGDADMADDSLDSFVMIDCPACGGGPLKPDVIFFGETVPRDRVQRCFELVDSASALLVLGSSLKVMSGFRFVLRAAERGIPVAIVNQGATRGDKYAALKLDVSLKEVLVPLAGATALRFPV